MPTRKQKRENEILEFIQKNIDKNNWFSLTRENLIKEFSKGKLTEGEIEEILDDLEGIGFGEGDIEEKDIGFKIYILPELSKKVKERLGNKVYDEKRPFYLISFFVIVVIVRIFFYKSIFYNLPAYINLPREFMIALIGSLIYVGGSWCLGNLIYFAISRIKTLRPIVRKYSWWIYSYAGLIILILILYYTIGFSKDTLVTSLVGGAGVVGTVINTLIQLTKKYNKRNKR